MVAILVLTVVVSMVMALIIAVFEKPDEVGAREGFTDAQQRQLPQGQGQQ